MSSLNARIWATRRAAPTPLILQQDTSNHSILRDGFNDRRFAPGKLAIEEGRDRGRDDFHIDVGMAQTFQRLFFGVGQDFSDGVRRMTQ